MMQIKKQLFDDAVQIIKRQFDELITGSPQNIRQLCDSPSLKIGGVYVLSEYESAAGEKFFYVGQAGSLSTRLREHCAYTSSKKANLAYMLTMEMTDRKLIPGSPNSTKDSMFNDSSFTNVFDKTVERIKDMNYRYVKVDKKLERNLLELYASVVLESRYNDFD